MQSTTKRLIDKMIRVFDADVKLVDEYPSDGVATVAVDGWPDAIGYNVEPALAVLRKYRDGAGLTESGDATVCADLEQAGAKLSDRALAIVVERQLAADEIDYCDGGA